jgi:hypothetical protein
MGYDRCSPPEATALDELSLPERFAIWAFRCIDHEPRACHARQRKAPPGLTSELHAVIRQFQVFQNEMHAEGGAGLRMAEWGTLHLSRDERRLLRAVAACQTGQTELVDNFLFRFAPRSAVRAGLTQAVAALAATLGAGGYWLPQPADTWPMPAAALPVARLHGAELADLQIAWP